jgi:hypothetical protein
MLTYAVNLAHGYINLSAYLNIYPSIGTMINVGDVLKIDLLKTNKCTPLEFSMKKNLSCVKDR